MTKKIQIAKEGKMDRLKSNWKKVALAIIGLGAVIYFILTGEELDLSQITGLLK